MENFLQNVIGLSEWNSFGTLWLPIGFKVMVSILCGGIIGLERELKHKPAGLRTNILICLGATLYTTLSIVISNPNGISEAGHGGDPARIAAQIVSGIGFLGGGMIIQSGGSVLGLTSAATVWVVAAIGVCIGVGFPIIAFIFTVTVFFTLYVLSKVDNKVFGKLHCYEAWITLKHTDTAARAKVMEAFQQSDLELNRLMVTETEQSCQIKAKYFSTEARHLRMQAALWSVPTVERIDVKMT